MKGEQVAVDVQDDGPGHSLAGSGVPPFLYGQCIGHGLEGP